MVHRTTQGGSAWRSLRATLVGLVGACWIVSGMAVGGVVCIGVWFLSSMPPLLEPGETRDSVGDHVYVMILAAGAISGLAGFFVLRPRSTKATSQVSARLPNKPMQTDDASHRD